PTDRPLRVMIEATGRGLERDAAWLVTEGTVGDADGAAGATTTLLAGTAAFGPGGASVAVDLAEADVAAVADAFGLDAQGRGEGRLALQWRPQHQVPLVLSGDARFEGVVEGRDVSAAATLADGEQRLHLVG